MRDQPASSAAPGGRRLVFLVMLPLLSIFGGIGVAALLWLVLIAVIVSALAVVLRNRLRRT